MGIALPGEDPIRDNFCTRRLAALFDLRAPGAATTGITGKEAVSGTLQVHLTGPGGSDWYVIVENGRTTRHHGTAARPDAAVTVSADDWAAIQRGEINPFNALDERKTHRRRRPYFVSAAGGCYCQALKPTLLLSFRATRGIFCVRRV